MKNSCDTNQNRTRDLSACSVVPQPTAQPRVPKKLDVVEIREEFQFKSQAGLQLWKNWMIPGT